MGLMVTYCAAKLVLSSLIFTVLSEHSTKASFFSHFPPPFVCKLMQGNVGVERSAFALHDVSSHSFDFYVRVSHYKKILGSLVHLPFTELN